ncbi:McrC family protein [Nibrella viscosa]|uniref:McrC family protein n=1 Tax=Nibrella viscosa TaxID=1084524 RepID=A0ABP8KEW1_9BACT
MWVNPIELIEHQRKPVPQAWWEQFAGLSQYLDEVWQTRTIFSDDDPEEAGSTRQRFLDFGLDQGHPTMQANQYVGFIQYHGLTLQILPKLFGTGQADAAFRHLLWWLHYSRRIRFPFADLLTGSETVADFPEALIRYFARITHNLVSTQPYHQYEEITETMPYLRGRLNTPAYTQRSLSTGHWHQLVCDHEPFLFNNRLNQIIKYVCRRLSHLCRPDTRRDLERVIFVLDEVDDIPCAAQDCDSIRLNRFFQEYAHCLDMCRFFLANSYLNRQDAHQRHFCFLVPMDVVYEDFITEVTRLHFGKPYRVQPQASDWLTDQRVFQIRNDLLLTNRTTGKQLIVDTKYKRRDLQPADAKQGISQTDLYQMVSYALRRATDQVLLLYPCAYGNAPAAPVQFTVTSGLLNTTSLHLRAADIAITGPSREQMVQQVIQQLSHVFNL